MIRLALSTLRHRTAAFLAVLVAVVLGAALITAAGGLFETGLRLNAPPQRYAAAPVIVAGDPAYHPPNGNGSVAYPERHGVSATLATELGTHPAVDRVVADYAFPAAIGAATTGHNWSASALTPYELTAGRAPSVGQLVLDERLAGSARLGDTVQVVVQGESREYTVAGTARPAGRVDSPVVFFADQEAVRLARGIVSAYGVFPAEGSWEALRLPAEVKAFTGDDRGAAEFAGIATSLPLIILSSVFGGMVAVVMALIVSATIGLSVRRRRRELALLRAGGATPQQVRRLVVTETMLVAGLGLIAGLLLGRIAGRWIFGMLAGAGIVPAQLRFDQGPLPYAAAVVLGILILWVSVGLSAGQAARIRPIQALTEAAIPTPVLSRSRQLLGLGFAAGTVAIASSTVFMSPANAAAIGGPAALTGSIAVALLGPQVIRRLLIPRLTAFLERAGGTSGMLAVINLRVRAAQFAAILVPLTLATAIGLGNIYSTTTQQRGATEAATDQLAGEVVVSGGIAPSLTEYVRGLPGVTAVSELVRSQGWIEEPYDSTHTSDPWPLIGVSKAGFDGKVAAGSLDDLTGDAVALPPGTAEKLGVGVGSEVGVRLGDNALVKLRVVALAEGTSILLPASLLAAHTTSGLPTQLLVQGSEDAVRAADFSRWPGATVGGRELLGAEFAAAPGFDAWIAYLLAGIAVAYAAIASINTIAVAVLDRRQEFGLQRLTGATRRQVKRMLYLENLVVAGFALVLGLITAAFTVLPIAVATRGWPLPAGPLLLLPAWALLLLALVLPVTAITARLALRPTPMAAVAAPA